MPSHRSSRASDWFRRRTSFGPGDDIAGLAEAKRHADVAISVCLPALNEAATVGPICSAIRDGLIETGLVDEMVVIDSGSTDETPAVAERSGASVFRIDEILPEMPPVEGKGEALWRSLAAVGGDIVVYVDADLVDFDLRFVTRLIEPLLHDGSIALVKAFYERPLGIEGIGGGRVTELLARPLLNLFYPELSQVIQPLAGEYAARVEVLRELPFFCGYGVEMGLLIDVVESRGLDSLAQAELGVRAHRNRPTAELGTMAFEIAKVVLDRAESSGRAKLGEMPDGFINFVDEGWLPRLHDVPLRERPPMADYDVSGDSAGAAATGEWGDAGTPNTRVAQR